MNKHLLYLVTIILASCGQEKKKSPNVFFAGEIVNPTSKQVFLYRNATVVDSVELDINNRFAFEVESIEEGLHHFNHGPENQVFHHCRSLNLKNQEFHHHLCLQYK